MSVLLSRDYATGIAAIFPGGGTPDSRARTDPVSIIGMGETSTRIRVLVVDDDLSIRSTIAGILEEDFEVTTCGSPRRALTLLSQSDYDLIVTDWQMPEMDGLEFARAALARYARLGCLLMTGQMDDLSQQVAWSERKTIGLLSKPFRPEQFLDRVTQVAQLARMKRSIAKLSGTTERKPLGQ